MTTTAIEADPIEVAIDQRGRAELEFIVAMGAASGKLRQRLADELKGRGLFDGDFTDCRFSVEVAVDAGIPR